MNFCKLKQCFTVSLGSKTALTYTLPHKARPQESILCQEIQSNYRVTPNIQILEKHVVKIWDIKTNWLETFQLLLQTQPKRMLFKRRACVIHRFYWSQHFAPLLYSFYKYKNDENVSYCLCEMPTDYSLFNRKEYTLYVIKQKFQMLFLAYFHHLTCWAWHHPPCCTFFFLCNVSSIQACEVFFTHLT